MSDLASMTNISPETAGNKDDIEIRSASIEDAEAILDIYAYYVKETAIAFECEVPTVEEFRKRIEKTLRKYPYFVAVRNGKITGYAYAGAFVGRAAYDWSAEMTIYLAADEKKRGLGRLLYETLEKALARMGITNLYACIGYPEVEDEYLTANSAQFHAHMGYVKCGEFHNCGYKFGRWYHMIWMEKIIGTYEKEQPPVRCFAEVAERA
ncbi:MAG: GNAT family N-acetyltransferase [Ruminococcus sp.]|nr:GNAT family N-acetyltransferase [Ruminococcus sp.]